MKNIGAMAALLAMSGPALAVAASEPTQPPPDLGERRRSRLRFGAYTPAKRAAARNLLAYKRQRRANRLRRKALQGK
jgi:hypothetical protein